MLVIGISLFNLFAGALGVWASVVVLAGGAAGFVALLTGRPIARVIEELQLGLIAAMPSGFLLFIAALFLLD